MGINPFVVIPLLRNKISHRGWDGLGNKLKAERAGFFKDEILQDAIIRRLEIIGEASNRQCFISLYENN